MNEYLICIGFPKWQGDYAKSTVMMMRKLAAYYNIIYVDYPHTFKDLVAGIFNLNNSVPVLRMLGIRKRLRCDIEDKNIWILTPPCILPINWIQNEKLFRFFLRFNNFIVRLSIRRSMKKIGFKNPIVVNAFNPFLGLFNIGKFNESCHVYYCYDEINQAKWMKKHGGGIEKDFVKNADAVIVSSQSLLEKMQTLNTASYLVENGVDFELFNAVSIIPCKPKIQTIGYTGSIDDRLDYLFIEFLVRNLPGIRFRFVGRVTDHRLIQNLKNYANISFDDAVDYKQLPSVLAQLDLCLIPFLKNDFTRNIYPMKLNEYLASGKPVIMTDFSYLPEYQKVVYVCEKAEFALKIIQELNFSGEEIKNKIQEGISLAKEASWKKRAMNFKSILDKHSA